jgi:hypothetical protein
MINRMYRRIKTALRLIRNARAMYEALREIKVYDRDRVTAPERVAEEIDYNAIFAIAMTVLDEVEQPSVPWHQIDPLFLGESPLYVGSPMRVLR